MILLPDFFERSQTSLIRLRLPVGEVVDLLPNVHFGDGLFYARFHGAIVRQVE